MPLKAEDYNHVCVISIEGDLTIEITALLRKTVEARIDERQIVEYVVDCEKCGFIDSEGLETLLWLKRRCDDLFGQMKLAHLDENCRTILALTRLEHRFESHDELSGALKTMG